MKWGENMLVYHGSDSNFRVLRISKSLVKRQSTLDNEGLGIYFSLDKEVARSYGKYIYSLYVNDRYLMDFRKKDVCRGYVQKVVSYVRKVSGVYTSEFINLENVVSRVYLGGVAVSGVGREIGLMLDSVERFHLRYSESVKNKVRVALARCDRECPVAYLFNYHIKNTGVVKKVSDDIVIIYKKEQSY